MIEYADGRLVSSVVLIDQEQDIIRYFREVFKHLPDIEFYAMSHPDFGVATAALYGADVIITEIYYPRYEWNWGEELIERLRSYRPEAKIIVLSIHNEEEIIYKYKTVFGVDAWYTKPCNLEGIIRRVYELLGKPSPV
jgi:DNA-binding NarL/FixJ family response regulator